MNIYITRNGQQLGPFTLEQINSGASLGSFTTSDFAWIEGWTDWRPLSMVPGFAAPIPPPVAHIYSLPQNTSAASRHGQTTGSKEAIHSTQRRWVFLGLFVALILIGSYACAHHTISKTASSAMTWDAWVAEQRQQNSPQTAGGAVARATTPDSQKAEFNLSSNAVNSQTAETETSAPRSEVNTKKHDDDLWIALDIQIIQTDESYVFAREMLCYETSHELYQMRISHTEPEKYDYYTMIPDGRKIVISNCSIRNQLVDNQRVSVILVRDGIYRDGMQTLPKYRYLRAYKVH